jgi:hypothetical protein
MFTSCNRRGGLVAVSYHFNARLTILSFTDQFGLVSLGLVAFGFLA